MMKILGNTLPSTLQNLYKRVQIEYIWTHPVPKELLSWFWFKTLLVDWGRRGLFFTHLKGEQ